MTKSFYSIDNLNLLNTGVNKPHTNITIYIPKLKLNTFIITADNIPTNSAYITLPLLTTGVAVDNEATNIATNINPLVNVLINNSLNLIGIIPNEVM